MVRCTGARMPSMASPVPRCSDIASAWLTVPVTTSITVVTSDRHVELFHLGAENQTQNFRISLSVSDTVVITGSD